jgi:hypothetical protein
VLDDGSTDSTSSILENLKTELPIVEIIQNEISEWETGRESNNLQKLLEAGRRAGGTHFILMDADEIISANALKDNLLRKIILSLKPGDVIALEWIPLWRSPFYYRVDDNCYVKGDKHIIFCDTGSASYTTSYIHGARLPSDLRGKLIKLSQFVLLHFQFVNWNNLLEKQAWYRCLEHVKKIQSPVAINNRYRRSKDEKGIQLRPVRPEWFAEYENFDYEIYNLPVKWRKQQVLKWFAHYGIEYFKGLDIWDVDWYA